MGRPKSAGTAQPPRDPLPTIVAPRRFSSEVRRRRALPGAGSLPRLEALRAGGMRLPVARRDVAEEGGERGAQRWQGPAARSRPGGNEQEAARCGRRCRVPRQGWRRSLLRLLLSCQAWQHGRRLPGDGAGTPGVSASSRGQAAPRLLSCCNSASPGRCVPPAAPPPAPSEPRSPSHQARGCVAAPASGRVPAGHRWPWGGGPTLLPMVGLVLGAWCRPAPWHSSRRAAGLRGEERCRAGWATCGSGPGAVLSQNIPG